MRHGKVQDVEDGLSEFPPVILNQARVHDFLLESMVNSESRLVPHYARTLADLELNEGDYPISVSFMQEAVGAANSCAIKVCWLPSLQLTKKHTASSIAGIGILYSEDLDVVLQVFETDNFVIH